MSIKKGLVLAGVALSFAAGFVVRGTIGADALYAQAGDRVYELRTYTAAPGKFDAINARFRDHTVRLFARHGIKDVAYLTPTEGPLVGNTLIYMLVHQNRAAADQFWKAFQSDPEWIKARDASVADGPITTSVTRVWLKPTDWSQVK
jgi:NIPSNAP